MTTRRTRHPEEVRERAVRMLLEHRRDYGSEWQAIRSIAEKVGIHPETLRIWVRRVQVDAGLRPGLTTEERERLKQLERENRELRRANEILKSASAFFAAELGRGHGNSTALFCQALSRLGEGRVVSLCFSSAWETSTRPKLEAWLPDEWFGPLDARTGDILVADFEGILEGQSRVLVLWDAHGFEVASAVLGRILPALVDRPHLVLMHDISDARYQPPSTRSYARPSHLAGGGLAGADERVGKPCAHRLDGLVSEPGHRNR